MTAKSTIPICKPEGQKLNGLGNMVMQFMQQEFGALDYKSDKARTINCKMSMEVEGGISISVSFEGDRILVENGVVERPDLYMQGPYMVMTDIICGKVSPVMEILKFNVKLKAFPRKPIQGFKILSILKIDPEAEYVLDEEI